MNELFTTYLSWFQKREDLLKTLDYPDSYLFLGNENPPDESSRSSESYQVDAGQNDRQTETGWKPPSPAGTPTNTRLSLFRANGFWNHVGGENLGGLSKNQEFHEANFSGVLCTCPNCIGPDKVGAKLQNITASNPQIAAASFALSGTPQIDGILSGYQWKFSWGNRILNYSFYEDTVFNGKYSYGTETGVREVSEGVKANVRKILQWYGNVLNITFQEVIETNTRTYGRMRFMCSNNPSYAYAYYPSSDTLASRGGDVHLNPGYDRTGDTNGFQNAAGSHGFLSLIHEIGHALGLKHSFEGTSSSPSTLPGDKDNFTNTVMTYNFSNAEPATLMRYDLAALQYLYGKNTSFNSTDTIYQFTGKADGYSVNGQPLFNSFYSSVKQLIWDAGGKDTLDFSGLAASVAGYHLDLNPGGLLTEKSYYNPSGDTFVLGTAIAYDVLFEDVINSGSSDEIFLNSADNTIGGYTARRVVGADTIWYGSDRDILDLSDYSSTAVTNARSGDDLILTLGGNGSVTLKNYFAGASIQLRYSQAQEIVLPKISIVNSSVLEGNKGQKNAIFSVNLDKATDKTIRVQYATSNGTAVAGSDYIAASGTLTFAPGVTGQTVSVAVLGDTSVERDETFYLNLSDATNATFADAPGVGTILNDDVPPLLIGDVIASEGTGGQTNFAFNVSLEQASPVTVTVQYATSNGTAVAGSDYTAASGTLTFAPGVTSQTVNVAVFGDTIVESSEAFFVNLSNATNATIFDGLGIALILDDDALAPPTVAIASPTVDPLAGGIPILVGGSDSNSSEKVASEPGILAPASLPDMNRVLGDTFGSSSGVPDLGLVSPFGDGVNGTLVPDPGPLALAR